MRNLDCGDTMGRGKALQPWLVWLSGQSVGPRTDGSQTQFQSRACTLVAGLIPSPALVSGCVQRQPMDASLSHR